jgi:tetratricopeptide (TPR) repeat protein
MRTLTRQYRLVALGIGSLLVVGVVALRSSLLLGAFWSNSGFVQFNHTLSQDISSPSLYTRTAAALEKATTYNPQNDSAWRALGYTSFLMGDEATAVGNWQNAPSMVGEIIGKGQAARLEDNHKAALFWFDLATQIAPELADGWYFLGLEQESQGDWVQAVESYQTAVSRVNGERVGRSDPYFRRGRARWQVEGGEAKEEVLADLQQALETDDFTGEWARIQTHYLRGVVLKQAGQGGEAAAEFSWVVENDPDDYWAHVQLGLLAWELDDDVVAAEAWLLKANDLAENNKWAYRYLGQLYEELGRNDEAETMFRKVLAFDPDDPIAAAYLSQGEK